MERASLSVEWLEQARLERNWTQEYVAEQIAVTSLTVRRWEHGQNRPQTRQYYQLCKLFQRELPPGFQIEEEAPSSDEGGKEKQVFTREEGQTSLVVSSCEIDDTCARFQASDLTVRLLRVIWTWPIRNVNTRYHELQAFLERELKQRDNTTMQENPINRRNALRRIAVLPIEIYGLSLVRPTIPHAPDELLTQCAAGLTACWHLRKGKDLAFAFDTASRYIPTLKEIATTGSSAYRKDAAELLVQCYLLKSVLAWNVTTIADAASYAQEAVRYGETIGNMALRITTLRTQAAVFCYGNQWDQALQAGEKARSLLETVRGAPIPPLLSSYVYAGIATYQAYKGRKEDALSSLKKAHATFFASSPDDTLPIWVDHSIGNLLDNDGLTHYHLGLYKASSDSFSQIDDHYSHENTIPASCRVAALVERTMTEVLRDDQPRDMDLCIDLWTRGIEGAKTLQSNRCFDDAIHAFTAMRAVWPGESRIKDLRDQIEHW